MTPRRSRRSAFDAFRAAARRRDIAVEVIESSGNTLLAEFSDAEFLLPFVGTHRIQRIPKGETRRHTSTTTLAVLEDATPVEQELDEADLEEVFTRGSGPGGQHRNKVATTVVLTHKPSGVSVRADGRSQWQNRQTARAELARRLAEELHRTTCGDLNDMRQDQIGSGERAAKSFTYNEQRDEVIDHSTGQKWRMSAFMKGRF